MVADCSGCGEEGEYWIRVYRDHNYYRIHLVSTNGGPTSGKFCGNYSENVRWIRPPTDDDEKRSHTLKIEGKSAPDKTATSEDRKVKASSRPSSKQPSKRSRVSEPEVASDSGEDESSGNDDDSSSSSDGGESVFPCSTCGRDFVSATRLSDHQRRSVGCAPDDKRSGRRNSRELREAALETQSSASTSSKDASSSLEVDAKLKSSSPRENNNGGASSDSKYDVADETIALSRKSATDMHSPVNDRSSEHDRHPSYAASHHSEGASKLPSSPRHATDGSAEVKSRQTHHYQGQNRRDGYLATGGRPSPQSDSSRNISKESRDWDSSGGRDQRSPRDHFKGSFRDRARGGFRDRERDRDRDRNRGSYSPRRGHGGTGPNQSYSSTVDSVPTGSYVYPPERSGGTDHWNHSPSVSAGPGSGSGGGFYSRPQGDPRAAPAPPPPPMNLIGKRQRSTDSGSGMGHGIAANRHIDSHNNSGNFNSSNTRQYASGGAYDHNSPYQHQHSSHMTSHHQSQHSSGSFSRRSRFTD